MAIYHRIQTRTQTSEVARLQIASSKMCGFPNTIMGGGGGLPAVKAYDGPLPKGEIGIEFETDVPPYPYAAPGDVYWYQGYEGVIDSGGGMVCISVRITKCNQKL